MFILVYMKTWILSLVTRLQKLSYVGNYSMVRNYTVFRGNRNTVHEIWMGYLTSCIYGNFSVPCAHVRYRRYYFAIYRVFNFKCFSSRCFNPLSVDISFGTFGTIPILRQQWDWVGGVKKMAIFADVQYYLCWRRVSGWVRKSPKICWRNIGMEPLRRDAIVRRWKLFMMKEKTH